MKYVSVFVHQKTQSGRSYDYIVPPELSLVENQLVKVPFGNKKVLGLIAKVKPSSRLAKKKILRSLSKGPIITARQRDLALELSKRYRADLGDILTSFLPLLNKKDFLKLGANIGISSRKATPEKILLIAERESRLTYYLQKISRLSQNLILLPTIYQIENLKLKIKNLQPELPVAIWHSGLTSREKAEIWQKLLEGDNPLVIGTRQALFLPLTNIGTIIIDDPLNFAYQEDQSPYYNAYPVARMLSEITKSDLIVGEDTPDVISYSALLTRKLKLVEIKSSLKISIGRVWAKATQNNDFYQKISAAIQSGAKIAVIGPWRDQIRLVCRDCKQETICSKCQNGHFGENSHTCVACGTSASVICAGCQSTKLDSVGFSYKNITEQIKKFWPKLSGYAPITVLSPNELGHLQPTVDYFVFPFFDFMINSPRLGARQGLFRLIRELSAFSPKEIFLFGENLNESEFVNRIVLNDWRAFLQGELHERKKLDLPPFTQAVLAVSRAKNKSLAQKHLAKFSAQLPESIPIFPTKSSILFLVNHNFDFSHLNLPSSIHLEIDQSDLV